MTALLQEEVFIVIILSGTPLDVSTPGVEFKDSLDPLQACPVGSAVMIKAKMVVNGALFVSNPGYKYLIVKVVGAPASVKLTEGVTRNNYKAKAVTVSTLTPLGKNVVALLKYSYLKCTHLALQYCLHLLTRLVTILSSSTDQTRYNTVFIH